MRYLKSASLLLFIIFMMSGGKKEVRLTEGIQPGNLAPVINMQGIDLKESDYILVQFWSPSDPQSRMENTRMHNVITQRSEKDIRLVSISLDENEAVFKGVIKADKLNGNTQYRQSDLLTPETIKKHRLSSQSKNWLVDSKGMIINTGLNTEDITAF